MSLSARLLTKLSLPVLLAGTLSLGTAATPAHAATLSGQVRLVEKGKEKDDREVRTAVVYFIPDKVVEPVAPEEPFQVTMARKSFMPRVLAVPVGSKVRFPNDDRILHNAFSLSQGNRFDLGLYRRGEAKEAEMKQPGVVQVFCNVHHSMVAYVLALETPFFTYPDADGNFTLTELPDGPGRLEVWHERAQQQSLAIQVPTTQQLSVRLEITKPRLQPHRNKFGKPYKRRRGKAY